MRSKQKKKLLLLALELLILLVLIGIFVIYQMTFGKMNLEDKLDDDKVGINTDIDADTILAQEGYTNIALFGLDNRSEGKYESGNADTIMIASINNKTKEVKLVSVYRDTFLSIGNGKFRKANASYASGGVSQAVAMLNSNFDLTITEYVCVDWAVVIKAIDALGGIDLEITEAEMKQINKYLHDVDKVTGKTTAHLTTYGQIHLDGSQACTYARIRKLAGDDYKRASRQRIVLQAMLTKAKSADLVDLTEVCKAVFGDISTSLTIKEILAMATYVPKYEIVDTTGFPFKLTNQRLSATGDTVIPVELDNNVEELHRFLFGNENYTLSQTVQSISNDIVIKTGIDSTSSTVDTSSYNDTTGKKGTESTSSDGGNNETGNKR